ncbi:macoilin-like [Glandiceps talaboti]
MKRRNAECGKLRRPLKRNKITEGIYGSTFLYLKFLMIWALVLLADFILEFRFEYLWPFWLLLRSVYDSFKYQGLAFSVFFICIAFTSDMVCLLFIPVHWLFFAASTYVWVQFVWHTERGICLPTISLWLLFVYIEASVRLRELRTALPFHLDLCRPFAAHCIGYPMVTLGFGVKSYVSYRMRLRKQKEVAKDNEFYMQLLQQALPVEQQTTTIIATEKKAITAKPHEDIVANGVSHKKGATIPNGTSTKGTIDSEHKVKEKKQMSNNNASCDPPSGENDFIETKLHNKRSNTDFDGTKENLANEKMKCFKSNSATTTAKSKNATMAKENTLAQNKKKNVAKTENLDFTSNMVTSTYKEDKCFRLEADIKRLKADLQCSRQTEQELRSQIISLQLEEKSVKTEIQKVREANENLQTKLHNMVTQKQQDKQNLSKLEQKLKVEKESRSSAEIQLRDERKLKKAEEAAASRAVALATARMGECSDNCKSRKSELAEEAKQLQQKLKDSEEAIKKLEKEAELLRQKEESMKETDILMSHLTVMQDKNTHLENSLSAETRLKLDLFSALGDARRQLEIAQGQLSKKDIEINELKSKIAEVMAVMPASTYPGAVTSTVSSVTPRYSASFCNLDDETHMGSSLDPNASVYHPKQN